MAYLVLVRHGQSKWNALGRWTGWRNIGLTKKGGREAVKDALEINDIDFRIAYVSKLKRAQKTLRTILDKLGERNIPIIENAALNERDYGDLTGQNKWKIKAMYGIKKFLRFRRGWNYPIPGGETLKDVYERVVPYYQQAILPKLKEGQNVLIVAHGNSLRALVKYLEKINIDEIPKLEIPFTTIYVYKINGQGEVISREIRKA